MADSEVDTTQQVTSQTPATKPKNPKRVAAGKLIAEKTKRTREEQKKALAEARVIIANNKMKTDLPAVSDPEPTTPEPPVPEPPADEQSKITTTQWLSVISIIVSLVGIYYKREEIKGLLTPQANTPPPSPLLPRAPPASPVLPRAPPATPKRGGIRSMD